MTGAGDLLVLAWAGGASATVLLYFGVFRLPPELRRARAFLSFRSYVRLWRLMVPALVGVSCLLLYTLLANPGAMDPADGVFYTAAPLLLSLGFLHAAYQVAAGGACIGSK